eukprot:COSAG01_NODE_33977_length_555_cov_1.541667_1_plen_81_part_01
MRHFHSVIVTVMTVVAHVNVCVGLLLHLSPCPIARVGATDEACLVATYVTTQNYFSFKARDRPAPGTAPPPCPRTPPCSPA